jgi:aspartyl-tRNA(Asn)/glutamyl-tRNA(Gln) amidotransferase subunit A
MPLPAQLAFTPLDQLARKLRAGEFTSLELTQFFLDRLTRLGPRCGAVATLCTDLALADARRADEDLKAGRDRGPLHGLPIGVKDLLAIPGYPTTWGAAPFRDTIREGEATVVRKLREAGAILVAKLAMIELAGGLGYRQGNASWTGPAKNPWDESTWAGGSSSGSGAAVAAGLVPAAIGSETWGSILTPASYCGVVGYRPTYGLVSKAGAMALSWSMDKLGPLTRTAADAATLVAAIAGVDPADDSTVDRPFQPVKGPFDGPFRVGILRDPREKVQPAIAQSFAKSLDILATCAELEPVSLPELPYATVAGTLIACEMSAAFEPLVASGAVWELTASEDRPGAHAAQFIPARDYIHALRIRAKMVRALDELFQKFDAIVAPATATTAVALDREFGESQIGFRASQLGAASNVCGLPGLFLPNGFDDHRRPTSIQLVGRAFTDARLLALGQALQARTTWHEQSPKGWD